MEKLWMSVCIILDFDVFRWIFLVYINLVFVDKENEVVNGYFEGGKNGVVDNKDGLVDVGDW